MAPMMGVRGGETSSASGRGGRGGDGVRGLQQVDVHQAAAVSSTVTMIGAQVRLTSRTTEKGRRQSWLRLLP